ncbi:MAG: polyprenyl synthetase family protein, partial [Bacteroidaceae bacterium]|nr:polyprenyl synthetase family protein [Bacteroidaceae bacterium]
MDVLQQIRKPIEEELVQYRKVFESFLTHDNELLQSALNAVASRQGKMMRPILTLLVAKLLGEINQNSISTAATFEFFHTASLLHDDIVDESDERRGRPSINKAYGNKIAVLVGDFILANSLINASNTGNTELVNIVSVEAQRHAAGELLQLSNVQNNDFSEQVYFDIICGKTAALFAACGEGG